MTAAIVALPLAIAFGVASGAGLGAVLAMAANWPTDLLGMAAVPAGQDLDDGRGLSVRAGPSLRSSQFSVSTVSW